MMEFLAENFNLPTIIVAAIVFGCVGWITWHSHKRVEKQIGPRPFLEK